MKASSDSFSPSFSLTLRSISAVRSGGRTLLNQPRSHGERSMLVAAAMHRQTESVNREHVTCRQEHEQPEHQYQQERREEQVHAACTSRALAVTSDATASQFPSAEP